MRRMTSWRRRSSAAISDGAVDIAVLEARFLAHESSSAGTRGLGLVQQLDALGQQFDLAGSQIGVPVPAGRAPHLAADAHHVLAAQALGLGEHFRRIRIEHDLPGRPLASRRSDENDAAGGVVTTAMHPAADMDGLTGQASVTGRSNEYASWES